MVPSPQYDLFASFFGEAVDLSNTIELWDSIPKYAVTARRQAGMRNEQGRLSIYEYAFRYNKTACRLEIQPATIKIDGDFRDFYPSVDEELVEEVIRKIFADQRFGIHDALAAESWVRFSLSMIRKELRTRGKTRSLGEIKRSIEILANTTIRLYVADDPSPIYTNPILSDVTRVTRQMYLEDASTMWCARLPALVSKSINDASYRQFNYGAFMAMRSQLARWLHKQLSHRYVNASFMHNYSVLFSTLKRDSGLLEANRISKNVGALECALDELRAAGVLLGWNKEVRRGSKNRIADIYYHLQADPDFVRHVKAANRRQSDARDRLSPTRAIPVGKSVGSPGDRYRSR